MTIPSISIPKIVFTKSTWALLVILAVGILLRLVFWTGSAFPQSIEIAKALWFSSTGLREMLLIRDSGQDLFDALSITRSLIGLRKFIFFSPSIILYVVLGFNDWVSGIYPLVSTLSIAVWLYLLGKENGNKAAGLLVAWVWLIAPLVIATSSTLFAFQPILAAILGAVYFFKRWQKRKTAPNILLSLALLTYSALGEPFWGGIGLLLLLGIYILSVWPLKRFWLFVGAASLTVLILFPIQSFYGLLSWYRQLIAVPGVWLLFSLFAISLIPAYKRSSFNTVQHFYLYWLVLGVVANGLCESTMGLCTGFIGLGLPIYTLFVLIPMFLLSAQQLAIVIGRDDRDLKIMWIVLAIGLLSLAVYFVPWEISPSYEVDLLFNPRIILLLSNLALAFAFLSALAFVYFSGNGSSRWGPLTGLIFISLFSFAALHPSWEWGQQHAITSLVIKKAFSDYQQSNQDLPLTFVDEALAMKTDYFSGFAMLGGINFTEGSKSIEVVSNSEIFSVLDSFVIIRSPEATSLPPRNWLLISEYDQIDGSKLQLYRSLSDNTAKNLTIQATELVSQEPSSENYENLYGTLINNNEPCNAYQAWMHSIEIGRNSGYIQMDTSANCFCPNKNAETIDLTTSIETIYPGAYLSITDIETSIDDFSRISNVYAFYQDPRTYRIPITLSPDQFYSFSVDIQANQPVIGLFIKVGKAEWYLPKRSYPEDWAHLEVLFSTHAWDSQKEVILSPALFEPGGLIDVKNYELTQTEFCTDQ